MLKCKAIILKAIDIHLAKRSRRVAIALQDTFFLFLPSVTFNISCLPGHIREYGLHNLFNRIVMSRVV